MPRQRMQFIVHRFGVGKYLRHVSFKHDHVCALRIPDMARSKETHACPQRHPASSLTLQMSEREKLMRAAERFLELVPVQTRERGRYYHATGHVLKVTCLKPDQAYTAIVRGNHDYAVRLTFSEQTWTSDCSCPMGYDCKHTVAAMLELKALWAKDFPAAPGAVSASRNRLSKKKPVRVFKPLVPQ